jgi:glycosyltransferase involved in cell wall biosynthesis
MDEHVTFKNADPKLVEAEDLILEKANIVFAGGRSLYESKKNKNPNCYLFSSCVDNEHFSKARDSHTLVPNDLKDITKPVIGYLGAVDERLDYRLIEKLAVKNRNFSFVFIGPIIKVERKELPAQKNILYLGAREYKILPSYLKGFNIGFMPFAMTPVTKMISPTKTLEYFAAGLRVVSTPITDVVSDFKGIVRIGHNADEISNHLREVLNNKEPDIIRLGIETAAKNTWDGMVDKMGKIITEKL